MCYCESKWDCLGDEDLNGFGDSRPCDATCGKSLSLGDEAIFTEDGEAYCSEVCFDQAAEAEAEKVLELARGF